MFLALAARQVILMMTLPRRAGVILRPHQPGRAGSFPLPILVLVAALIYPIRGPTPLTCQTFGKRLSF
jgi:hypothetical protein